MNRARARGPVVRLGLFAGVLAAILVPALALAHPLGNFTINHYAEIRVEPDRILLDVVIDQAEIPTFQARLDFDTDGDAEVSDDEVDAGRVTACNTLSEDLRLAIDDTGLDLTLVEAGLAFPPGAGGLSTMRLVCGFEATLPSPITAATPSLIAFSDASFAERLGWREIVATGSGTVLAASEGELRSTTISERLTAYPKDLVARPLADTAIVVSATAGGESMGPLVIADADPVAPALPGGEPSTPLPTAGQPTSAPTPDRAAAVPGGVGGGELPSIFREADVTPIVLLLSVLTAAVLGAGHALTPGHGKTLMAAYLVGTRGTPVHALGLGLSVSLSHTVGILALAAVIVGAADVLPAESVVRVAPIIAAISIMAIGGWMLVGEVRRRRTAGAGGEHGHDHDHDEATHSAGEHSHGGIRHSHLPPGGSTITWRSLFVLGLAGGLIPSTSALLILLGSIAAGRPGFGFVLVVAFGLGMAAVMTGLGLALVFARGRLDGASVGPRVGRVRDAVPLAAAVLVFGFGLYLTAQAVAGTPAL